MTGWRIGFAANRILAPVFTKWITNTDSCASQISQWAAVEAVNGSQYAAQSMREKFARRLQEGDAYSFTLTEPDFAVESYLRHQADSFAGSARSGSRSSRPATGPICSHWPQSEHLGRESPQYFRKFWIRRVLRTPRAAEKISGFDVRLIPQLRQPALCFGRRRGGTDRRRAKRHVGRENGRPIRMPAQIPSGEQLRNQLALPVARRRK